MKIDKSRKIKFSHTAINLIIKLLDSLFLKKYKLNVNGKYILRKKEKK